MRRWFRRDPLVKYTPGEWYDNGVKKSLTYVQDFVSEYGKITIAGVSFLVVGISCFVLAQYIPQKLTISFLDVGQGDAILIQTPSGKTMLVDGGPNASVIKELDHTLSFFNRTLDVMIATHPDSDHITGLIPTLLRYDTKNIIVSNKENDTELFIDFKKYVEKEEGSSLYTARVGDSIDFQDGVHAFILHPASQFLKKDTNEASVSFVLVYGNHSFLLTGDLPASNEEALLAHKKLSRDVTVFKAGHHGSNTSSGERLLSYIRPEYAVISAGKDNRYGHPHEETLARLKKYSKEVISTIDRGTISFISDGRVLDIVTAK